MERRAQGVGTHTEEALRKGAPDRGTEIIKTAKAEAERIIEEAQAQSREIRLEAEDYADERLANLEVTCYKLLEVIKRARERLQGPQEQAEEKEEFDLE